MIEKELWRIRGEIERIEAQLKSLERMAIYSSISIWIRVPEAEPSPYPKIDFTPVLSTAATALIYIVYGLISYGGYIIYRRVFGKRPQSSPQNISLRQP